MSLLANYTPYLLALLIGMFIGIVITKENRDDVL